MLDQNSSQLNRDYLHINGGIADSELDEAALMLKIFNSLPYYIVVINGDREVLLANRRAKRWLDRKPYAILKEDCKELIQESNKTFPDYSWIPRLDDCSPVVEEVQDPESGKFFRSAVYPLLDGLFLHSIEDITETKKEQFELRIRQEAMAASMDGMAVLDEMGCYIYLNEVHAEIYGYENPDQLYGSHWSELYDTEERKRLEEKVLPAVESSGKWRGEAVGLKSDGSTFPQELTLSLIKEPTPEAFPEGSYLICVVRDITDRKKRDEQVKKLASFPKNNPQPVVEWDTDLEPVYLNPSARKLTGDEPEKLTPEDMEDVYEKLEDKPREEYVVREVEIGEKIYAEYIYLFGQASRIRAYAYDITGRIEAQRNLEKTTIEVMQALSHTVEAKDKYTGEHLDRVEQYAIELGEELGLGDSKLEQLRYAAELHDIGKVKVPDKILGKEGPLTDEEWVQMEKHPEWGKRIVNNISRLNRAAKIIGQHQEKYDGNGYPQGLEEDEITLEARVLAVVDAWDAMTSDRPYREALSRQEAIKELKENSGTQFDPKVVDNFFELISEKS